MELQGLHGQMWQTVPEEMICTVLYSNNNTILGVFITIYPYPSFVSFIMLKSVTLQENKTILEYTLDRPGPARQHMCFLWWHSCFKIQWLFAK